MVLHSMHLKFFSPHYKQLFVFILFYMHYPIVNFTSTHISHRRRAEIPQHIIIVQYKSVCSMEVMYRPDVACLLLGLSILYERVLKLEVEI